MSFINSNQDNPKNFVSPKNYSNFKSSKEANNNNTNNFNFNSFQNTNSGNTNNQEDGKQNIFYNELKPLMYGFGDVENPDPETVDLLDQYVIEYIQNVGLLAFKRSKRRGFNEIKLKDLLYVIKNDKKKFYRVPSLLSFYEILKKTKRLESHTGKKGMKKHLKYLMQENNIK